MIKVAMILRSTLFTSGGGDTVQALETARLLKEHGFAVDVRLTNEAINYANYTLLHFFNITRPADILCHITKANKPYVVSPIDVNYSEYDKHHRRGIAGALLHCLPKDTIEYAKAISRWLARRDRLMSISYLWKGQKRSAREVIVKAKLLLPNSESEYKRLERTYQCKNKCAIVPNGVNTGLFLYDASAEKDPALVLCVARIEGIKNQLSLIRAINHTAFRLVIIGAAAANQRAYYKECRKIAAANISFAGHLSQEELVKWYRRAKVHVLPSWFETTGLSSLEAAAMGCNIVITDKGDAKEYFGADAFYCDPSSSQSIYNAIEQAAASPLNKTLLNRVREKYTWHQAGAITAKGYNEILNNRCD
jgi:glycosyltransferase involved in cell wall biosynthesis